MHDVTTVPLVPLARPPKVRTQLKLAISVSVSSGQIRWYYNKPQRKDTPPSHSNRLLREAYYTCSHEPS